MGTVGITSSGRMTGAFSRCWAFTKPRREAASPISYIPGMSFGWIRALPYSKAAPIWSTWLWVSTSSTGRSVSSRTKAFRLPMPESASMSRAFSVPSMR